VVLFRFCLIFVAVFSTSITRGQLDSLVAKERKLVFGFLNFVSAYEIKFSKQTEASSGFRFAEPLRGIGLRFTSEFKLSNSVSIRFEPGFVANRPTPVPPTYKSEGALSELQAPLLLKFSPIKRGKIIPYLVGGYLANYKLYEYFSDWSLLFDRRMDSAEFGLGVDFKLKKSSISVGARINEQISSDQLTELPTLGAVKTRSLMIYINFHSSKFLRKVNGTVL